MFCSPLNWAFDETPGINAIYDYHRIPYMDKFIYADIDVNYRDLRLVERDVDYYRNYPQQIFYWQEGRLLRDYVENGSIQTDEFAYIHLQKRLMQAPDFATDTLSAFYITNGSFIAKNGRTDVNAIQHLNKRDDINVPAKLYGGSYKKDLRWYWLGRRYLNGKYLLRQRLKQILSQLGLYETMRKLKH